jgi:HlyD family secretion protein
MGVKWFVLLFMAAVALCLVVWPGGALAPKAQGDREPPDEREYPAAPQGRTVQGIGYVEPAGEVRRLVFKIDGVIDECAVDLGDRVNRGDVLMTLANREEAAAVVVAEEDHKQALAEREQVLAGVNEHQIAAAKSKVDAIKERVRHAQKHAGRVGKLHKTKSLTESERDQADTDVVQAEAALKQATAELTALEKFVRPVDRAVADAKVAQAAARLSAARAHLDQTVLRAPGEGTVLEILRREGEASRDAQGGPAIVFADDSRLRVRAEIDDRYVYLLRIGQIATVFGRALGPGKYTGRLAVVKRLMGGKTVFACSASERKDLDVLQVLIDMPPGFEAPLGLQVDVAVEVKGVTEKVLAEE